MDHHADEASSRLDQIAAALGIPVSAFLKSAREPVAAAIAAKQEEELLRLFREICDPGTRERLLGFVRAVAEAAGGDEGS